MAENWECNHAAAAKFHHTLKPSAQVKLQFSMPNLSDVWTGGEDKVLALVPYFSNPVKSYSKPLTVKTPGKSFGAKFQVSLESFRRFDHKEPQEA